MGPMTKGDKKGNKEKTNDNKDLQEKILIIENLHNQDTKKPVTP